MPNNRVCQAKTNRSEWSYCNGELHALYTRRTERPARSYNGQYYALDADATPLEGKPKMRWVKIGDLCAKCGRLAIEPTFIESDHLTFQELRPAPQGGHLTREEAT